MRRIYFFIALVLCLTGTFPSMLWAEQSVAVSHVDGYFYDAVLGAPTAGDCLQVGYPVEFHIHVVNDEYPDCWWVPIFGFQICDGGGGIPAEWTWPSTNPYDCLVRDEPVWIDTLGGGILDSVYFEEPVIFSSVFKEFQGATGSDCDSIGFAGINTAPPSLWGPTQQPKALGGVDHDVFKLLLTPTAEGSIICLDIAVDMPSYEWGWSPLAFDGGVGCSASDTQADWGGPYCYTVAQGPCCGLYTGGITGNCNCSTDGKNTLSDITKLIDRVYISKEPLCCDENGNTNGSTDGKLTLSDITALIDNVYISKEPTALCPLGKTQKREVPCDGLK